MENNENMIEFLSGQRTATVTFTNVKHINRMKKLYEERKDEFKYFVENKDGSICAKIPLKWIKVNAGALPGTGKKREMTEEQKEELRQRLAAGRAKSAGKKK
jgi:hypothetical protein